jgi:hypothetical protein
MQVKVMENENRNAWTWGFNAGAEIGMVVWQ